MIKKALILDLDNTIYSVASIGHQLFQSLFELIEIDGEYSGEIGHIKEDIMRKPFQVVAQQYKFGEDLTRKGIELLKTLTYQGKIESFPDYQEVRILPLDKYLVTTGFRKLQESKVEGLKLEQDFREIHIVDPTISTLTKKDAFQAILNRHGYDKTEVLVIGDDLDSEIQAAVDLGIDSILYDKYDKASNTDIRRIKDLKEVASYINFPSDMQTD